MQGEKREPADLGSPQYYRLSHASNVKAEQIDDDLPSARNAMDRIEESLRVRKLVSELFVDHERESDLGTANPN